MGLALGFAVGEFVGLAVGVPVDGAHVGAGVGAAVQAVASNLRTSSPIQTDVDARTVTQDRANSPTMTSTMSTLSSVATRDLMFLAWNTRRMRPPGAVRH